MENEAGKVHAVVCYGDDVECGVLYAVKLMVAHVNESDELEHFDGLFKSITEVSDDTFGQVRKLGEVAEEMIRRGIQVMIKDKSL